MQDLITDSYSIFWQILIEVYPDLMELEPLMIFQAKLLCYAFAGAFFLLTMWFLYRLLSAFGRWILSWFSRGSN